MDAPGKGPGDAARLLQRLGEVRTVAIVGASERGALTSSLLENLTRYGIDGDALMLVNPRSPEVFGRVTVPSVRELPQRPDLVFSLMSPERTEALVPELGAVGCRVLAVASGGYAEAGEEGRERQEQLTAAVAAHDIALLGPNTLGYLAPHAGVGAWTGRVARRMNPGNIAFASQSSGILNMVLEIAAYRHFGVHSAISVGNEAQLDLGRVVSYLAAQPDVEVVSLIVEGTVAPASLARALAEVTSAGKKLVVLKFGTSELGQRNIETHSGRLGTGNAAWSALFTKVGAVVVDDIDQLMNATIALSAVATVGPVAWELNPLLMTVSGGDCGLLADQCERIGLELAPLSLEAGRKLVAWDDRLADRAPTNPVDFGGFEGSTDEVRRTIAEVVMSEPTVGLALVRLVVPWEFDDAVAQRFRDLHAIAQRAGVPLLAMSEASEFFEESWFVFFAELGMPMLVSYTPTLAVIRHMLRAARTAPATGTGWSGGVVPERGVAEAGLTRTWELGESVELLRSFGLPYVESGIVGAPADAVALAEQIGLPVCVKGLVPGIVHKAKAGYVRINVQAADTVHEICDEWSERAGGDIQFEVQTVVRGGRELFVGAWTDPLLGPVISVGHGGVDVEDRADVVHLLPPVTADEVLRAIQGVREPLDLPGGDVAQDFGRVIEAISALVADADGPGIEQLDVNPVLVTDSAVHLVDCVVVTTG